MRAALNGMLSAAVVGDCVYSAEVLFFCFVFDHVYFVLLKMDKRQHFLVTNFSS